MDTSLVAERATLIKSSYLLTYLLSRLQRKKKKGNWFKSVRKTFQEAFMFVDNLRLVRPLKRLKLKRHRTAYMHFPTPFPGKHLN